MRYFSLLMLVFVLFSCKNKESGSEKTATTTEKPAAVAISTAKAPPVYIDSSASEKQILAHLTQRKKDIQELLQTATPEEADKFYENYKKEDDSAVFVLMQRDNKFLEQYMGFYVTDDKTSETKFVVPKDKKPLITNIENHGLIIEEDGEGGAYFTRKPDYFYQIFNGKVSPDYQKYLEITKEEDKDRYGADAGIIVPWKNIGDRILARENFLKDFPNSKLSKEIKGQLKIYRWDYFAGEENTPVFYNPYDEGNETKIDADIYKEYQRFIKANPTSETTKILKELLKEPTEAIWTDNLNRLIGKRYE